MNSSLVNEKALEAFNRQSLVFDEHYGHDNLIAYKRKRVRDHILSFLKNDDRLLELNCGTGEDALYFSRKGFHVHATDASAGMMQQLRSKLNNERSKNISCEECSFTTLEELNYKGPFDHIYSNFGGLNCTSKLDKVLHSFDDLLKPGGHVTLVIINRFCLWETSLLFRGKFREATRRFFSNGGREAHIENTWFRCWYYSPSDVISNLPSFHLVSLEGLCTLVPPSYMKDFDEKHPRIYRYLVKKESAWKHKWFWRNVGDYFIITLQKPS